MKYSIAWCLFFFVFQVKSSEERFMVDTHSDSGLTSRIQRSIPLVGGQCPGGEPLGIPCDAKRPWPQCPPQSFCYATNTVDTGPYCCCPVWSTIGAAWRPSGPSYPYYPAMPENWPAVIQASANWGAPTTQFAGTVNQFGPLLELLQHRIAKHRQQRLSQNKLN